MRAVSCKEPLTEAPTRLSWSDKGSPGPGGQKPCEQERGTYCTLRVGAAASPPPESPRNSWSPGLNHSAQIHFTDFTKEGPRQPAPWKKALTRGFQPAQCLGFCAAVKCRGEGRGSPRSLHLILVDPHLKGQQLWPNHKSGKHRPHTHYVFY